MAGRRRAGVPLLRRCFHSAAHRHRQRSQRPVGHQVRGDEVLTFHRTDAGVKAIKALLKYPAPDMLNPLAETIANGYAHLDTSTNGSSLQPEDFSAEDLRR